MVVNNVHVRSIECVSNDNATSDLSKVLDGEFCPSGVHVRRYYRQKRGRYDHDVNTHNLNRSTTVV